MEWRLGLGERWLGPAAETLRRLGWTSLGSPRPRLRLGEWTLALVQVFEEPDKGLRLFSSGQ